MYNHSRERVAIQEHSVENDDPKRLFQCPYDELHMVSAARMPYHLMKCRKNYRGRELTVCPFNARHHIPRPEHRHHLATCPDRVLIERDHEYASRKSALDDSSYRGNVSVPCYTYEGYEPPQSSENWDDECDTSRTFMLAEEAPVHYYNPAVAYHQQAQGRIPGQDQPASLRRPHAPQPQSQVGLGYHGVPQLSSIGQPRQYGQAAGQPTQVTPTSFASVIGIGRGMPAVRPPAGLGRGVGQGNFNNAVPPPGFGRGRGQFRAPQIAANIYSTQQPISSPVELEGQTPTHDNLSGQKILGIGRGQQAIH